MALETWSEALSMLVLSLIVASVSPNDSSDAKQVCLRNYVQFTPNHTACMKPAASCKIKIKNVTPEEQLLIIDEHNRWRNHLASGNESHRGFPPSADMLRFVWDDELAYVAQKHAEQCEFEHDCYDCRKTAHYSVVGQNLYIYRTTRLKADSQWETVIKEWYDEIKIAPSDVWKSFDLHGLNIGHFTQIAWSKTNRVGCGYTSYENTNPETEAEAIFKTIQLYTCNYAPGGNYLNEPLYANGNAASQCPAGSQPSKVYPALCEYQASRPIAPTTTTNKKKKKSKKTKKKKTTKRKKVTTITTRVKTTLANGTNFTNTTTITRTVVAPSGDGAKNKTTTTTSNNTFWLTAFRRSSPNGDRARSLTHNSFAPWRNGALPKRTSESRLGSTSTPWWKSYTTPWTANVAGGPKANRTTRSYVMFEMSHNGVAQRYRHFH